MKKLIIIALALVTVSAFAKKLPIEFAPGLEGFCGKSTPVVTVGTIEFTNGTTVVEVPLVTFSGTTAKDTLQFTKVDPGFAIEVTSPLKAVGLRKLKQGSFAQIKVVGDAKFQVRLPGFTIGTIIARELKAIQCLSVLNCIDATTPKGITVKTKGTVSGCIEGVIKTLSANKFGQVDATSATAVKPGKTRISAKLPQDAGNTFIVVPGQFSPKSKNVNLVN